MLPTLPPPFIRQMQALLGAEWPLLEAALQAPAPVSIRLNPRKTVDGSRFTVDGGRFTVDGSRFTVDGSRFTVDGSRFTVDGGRFTVDGSRFTVDGGRFTVDGSRFTVDGGRFTVDGSRFTVDGARWTVDGARFTVDTGQRMPGSPPPQSPIYQSPITNSPIPKSPIYQSPITNSPIPKSPNHQTPIHQSPIPWHPQGFYLSERPVFTLDPTFHAGAYYVQEASSMFIHEALRQTMDFSKPLKILDLCAAPGGKSTLLADMATEDSLLISNETIRPRTGPLRENLERWGTPNVGITSGEVEEFAQLEDWFDLIVADAPCSGEGLFRKDPDAMREWSLPQVEFCAGRQRRILAAAVQALAPGGILLFSTCTYNAQENTENARWLAKEFDLEPIHLQIPEAWGIVQTDFGCQFYPHKVQGEGFFLSVFRKKAGEAKKHNPSALFKSIKPLPKALIAQAASWLTPDADVRFFLTPSGEVLALPAVLESQYLLLDKFLKTKWFGTNIGEFKGKDFIPSHALALSRWASTQLPAVDLSREQALLFLKKETFDPQAGAPLGWTLARFEGLNLGWVKILPNRLNNYLPQERRIRMALG